MAVSADASLAQLAEHDPHQRGRIERLLVESPSLRREVAELSREEYAAAREAASAETGFALRIFPKSLPYAPEQILDSEFYPGRIDE